MLFEKSYPDFSYPGPFRMCKCEGCGLLFNWPRLPDDALRSLYDGNYYFFQRQPAGEFQRASDIYRRTVALVSDQLTEKSVLEIGSAKGYLLAIMKRLGWNTQGIELASSAATYAQSKFKVNSFCGTLQEYVESGYLQVFPLVLAIDLLEHVPDPAVFVSCLRRVVADDGFLIIDTPNGGSANISVLGSGWKGFNPFHIFIFSATNLTMLLEKHGFVVTSVFSYGNLLVRGEDSDVKPRANRNPPSGTAKVWLKMLLKRARVFEFCLTVRDTFDKKIKALCQTDLRNAARTARVAPNYHDTADSKGPLADGCRGDNLVVIARKAG